MTEQPTPRPSLTSIAYQRLKDAIITCELAPGTRITERALARELGLGLTPVREGLGRLANEGLVITLPRRGYLVTPLTERGVDELFQVWRHVCGAVAELAVRNGSDDQLAHVIGVIEDSFERTGGSAVADNRHGEELFEAFGVAADNERLMALFHSLSTEIGRLFVLAFSESEGQEILRRRPNLEFVTLIRNRDAEGLRTQVMAFNDANHQLVRTLLRRHPSLTAASEPAAPQSVELAPK